MGNVRTFSNHVRWTDEEVAVLRAHYSTAEHDFLCSMLPGRSKSKIQNKANNLGLVRYVKPARTLDETRKIKREMMALRRLRDPEAARAYHRQRHHKNLEANKAKMRAYSERRFFWTKAMKLRGKNRATTKQLAALWKAQKGLCALSGRRLDRSAQVDHRLPKAKGGTDEITNLQWLCPNVNMAKRDLTDDQFIALCSDVAQWKKEPA
jgi:5-methylcytosine-specific restriction endonuclease McrA